MTVRDQHLCEYCGMEVPADGISIFADEKCKKDTVGVRFNHPNGSEVKDCWDFCSRDHLNRWLRDFEKALVDREKEKEKEKEKKDEPADP